ncbi:MAG: hypothetical protein CL489_02990 [Acidobacteria bacterium]|nr:hypothetical protein [Acidobacteriota bacterium]
MTRIDDLELLSSYKDDGDENTGLLDPLTAWRLARAYRGDEHLREVLRIESAVRSAEEQRYLYALYKSDPPKGNLAANPDRIIGEWQGEVWKGSYHMAQGPYGYAVDLTHHGRSTWVRCHEILRANGLHTTVPGEPWHHQAQTVRGPLPGPFPDWWEASEDGPAEWQDQVDPEIDWVGVLAAVAAQGKQVAAEPIRPGSRGPAVRTLQTRLAALGFEPGPADGIAGRQTASAVEAFQLDRGLVPDGIAGKRTWAALWAPEQE